MTADNNEPKNRKGVIRGAGRVIALPLTVPFRSMARSASLARESFKRTSDSTEVVKDLGLKIATDVKSASKKGGNDTFESIFSGQEGEELLQKNLRRFLLRKRAAIAMTMLFTLYGIAAVAAFHQVFGLLTFLGGVVFGTSICFESQFRLWQLRNRRLSIEEKGSAKHFLTECSILEIFKPEILGAQKSD